MSSSLNIFWITLKQSLNQIEPTKAFVIIGLLISIVILLFQTFNAECGNVADASLNFFHRDIPKTKNTAAIALRRFAKS